MKITNPITLDVARSNSYICLLAKQFDSNSRYLEITLADNGQPLTIPADASAVLRATRADGTGAVVSGTVANGKATVEIDDYILEVNGAVTLSLEISKDGEILTTPSCNLTIQKADASGWIRVYIADSSKAAGNYYITIGGVSYSFTTSQAIPAGGSVYFSSNNATAETRNATGTVIETGLVLTEGTTGTQLVTDVPTMSFLATIAGRVAALESEMPNKADKDGIIALAENLTPYSSTSGATQSVPFINQGTGTGNGESVVDTGSYLQFKKKLGNTVCVNQLVNPANYEADKTADGVTFEKQADGSIKITVATPPSASVKFRVTNYDFINGHHYLLATYPNYGNDKINLIVGTLSWSSLAVGSNGLYSTIWTAVDVGSNVMGINVRAGCAAGTYYARPIARDLDLWFGSNDRIPSDLLSHPENWGRYYAGSLAYNAGALESADGSILTSIPRNIFNKATSTAGKRFGSSGKQLIDRATGSVSDYIPTIPNTQYYARKVNGSSIGDTFVFYDGNKEYIGTTSLPGGTGLSGTVTVPSNCRFIRFQYETADADDVTFSIYYSGESGYDQSHPHSVLAEVDTGSEVLRSAGSVADEKTPDGTITRRVGVVDLGSLNYTYDATNQRFVTSGIRGLVKQTNRLTALICPIYEAKSNGEVFDANWDNVIYTASTDLYIHNHSYTDPAAFKTAMSGVYLYYELATPTTEQGTAFAENIPCDDFGSLMWTQTKGIPQGNEIFYPVDYKASLDTLLNRVEGDVGKIVTDDTYPDAPSSNGTYVLKVTVSDGTPTYSWVAE